MSTPAISGCSTTLTLREFLATLDRQTGRIPLEVLENALGRLDLRLEEVQRFAQFGQERYQRNLVHQGPAYQALLLCWRAGQRSPIHDHTGSSCGVRVVRGVATETVFDRTSEGHIYATCSRRLAEQGVCATQDEDIHQISNLESGDLITLHVYSPPLLCMNMYSLTDRGRRPFEDPIFVGVDGEGI